MNPNRSLSNFQGAVYQYTYNAKKASGVCLQNVTDYSSFGAALDGRTMQGEGYRYGYQGSEKDDEVKGSGNSYTTHFRQLDPRVGRWLSIDPKASSLSWQTPFCSMDNNPIVFNDPKGDWIPGVYYTKCVDDKTGETKKQGILVAYKEKGDNAATLADFMDVSQKEAQKMYSGITSNGMIIANCDAADIINEVINETLNPTGNDYVDDGYIADGWEENYNCWESTLALAKGKEPNYSNCIDQGGFFAKELRNTEKFTNVSEKPSEWNFGETAIRFAETGWTGANFTTHGATYLGTSKDGVVYVWSKEGRVEAPIITTLDKCIENWGEVQGSGPKENEGGFYNSNENP
jgi:RHS repeat-associated protein